MEKDRQSSWDYIKILLVFAITGSLSAFVPKYLMPLTGIEGGFLYGLVYFLLVTPVYIPLLLLMAFLFGKFDYFYDKQKKLGKWLLKRMGLGGNGDASSSSD
ncbi:MAG: DUF6787 family protein [Bacteroidota bacterium]